MATEAVNAPVNGNYGHHQPNPYAAAEHNFGSHQATNSSTTGYVSAATPSAPASNAAGNNEIPKEEVAWYFVEQYYTTMSRHSDKLYLFYNKRSQLVSGVEDEKVAVCMGQSSIKNRIKELDYNDCKVRVTNVDSQPSDDKIVIQVMGEMSNKSQPHRKFVQTFVLAAQTNGYFVLNDIFRYLRDDDEEVEAEDAPAAAGYLEPVHSAAEPSIATKESISSEDVAIVDKKLEEVAKAPVEASPVPSATNGTPVPEPEAAKPEEPAPAVSAPAETKAEEPEAPAVEAAAEPEKAKDPEPTPAPAPKEAPKAAAAPTGPPKPAVPKTWAQLASAKVAAAAAPAAASTPSAPAPSKPASAAAVPSTAAPGASTPAPPVREPSPVDSQKEGSTGGWQTAGHEHSRKASRAQAQPLVTQDGKVRAYVKNVYQSVDADALKAALSKFGELAYFDVSRPKNSAFVEFTTVAGFQAAVAANPHKIGSDNVYVEERRPAGTFTQRGGSGLRGPGRGGFDRPGQGRGGFSTKDAPRGGSFTGSRGRGGSVTPRGGRGAAQAA